MKKPLSLLSIMLLFVAGCSGLQKRTCLQSAAYQHGYKSAQAGHTVDSSPLYRGQVCNDYDEYPTSLYRSDFKAGWGKGKREYCTSSNYVRWGNEDGEKGRVEYPNNYSDAMKICLQDSEFKSTAMKKYRGGFIHSFCHPDRMETLGRDLAKEFVAFKTPLLKKHCGSKSASLVSVSRKAYQDQMQANCTASFWMVKGEEDAKAKRSKSVEIAKVQKCPESRRNNLVSQYSSAYNDRKAIMLQEEKLAFERKKEEERLEMEREKQRQQYELERQRTQILSDAVNNTTGGGANAGGGSGHHSGSRPYFFYNNGRKLSSSCAVDSRQREARIQVRNESNQHFSMSGNWNITYYDRAGRRLKTNREHEIMIFSSFETEEFEDRFIPHDAWRCVARYTK